MAKRINRSYPAAMRVRGPLYRGTKPRVRPARELRGDFDQNCQAFSDSLLPALPMTIRLMARAAKTHKRLVVDSKTGRYLKPDGTWTDDDAEAMDFDDISSLIELCAKYQIRNASVLLRFNSVPKFEVKIPLQK